MEKSYWFLPASNPQLNAREASALTIALSRNLLYTFLQINTMRLWVRIRASTNLTFSIHILCFLSLSWTSLTSVKENIVRKPGLVINITLKSPIRLEQAW